jgi:hypothetical protein
METKKQTAVEWLHQKLATSSSEELVGNINIWFMEAKSMEKEQIIDAWIDGEGYDDIAATPIAEQYYNETYNK